MKVVQGVSTLFPQQFTFNASVASRNGTTQWVSPSFTANGTQTVVSQVSYVPGGTLDLSEVVPDKWTLSSAACTLSSGSSTGTPTANRVDNITIQEGLITTCTFTNTEDLGEPMRASRWSRS